MVSLAKKLARLACTEYSIYFVYSYPQAAASHDKGELRNYCVRAVERSMIETLPENLLQEQAQYCGEGAVAYACFAGDRVVALCFYWYGERYKRRGFWPLSASEAKLVQIFTLPDARGRGAARALIAISSDDMLFKKGFNRLYARIWHSNAASRKAFEAVGWRSQALVIDILPRWYRRPVRLQVDLKSKSIQRIRLKGR